MSFGSPRPSSSDEEGLKQELASLARDAGMYLRVRGELLAIEIQEASEVLKKRGATLAIAAFFGCFAYLLIIVSLVGLLGHFLSSRGEGPFFGWAGSAFLIGAGHLTIAITLILKARRAPREPLFEYTRDEWAKDQAWIKANDSEKKS